MNTHNKTTFHMYNEHTAPMENAPVPYIKCGKHDVVCQNLKGFTRFCDKLFSNKKDGVYDGLKAFIRKLCDEPKGGDRTSSVISHVCEMAYRMAIQKGGWEVDNHIAYLSTVAFHKMIKDHKYIKTHSHKEVDDLDWIPMPGNGHNRSELKDIIHKGIEILQRLYPDDARIIEGMYKGYDNDNDALAEFVDRENDQAFRTAKTRAKARMRRILLDLMGRGPDRPGDGPGNVLFNLITFNNINDFRYSNFIKPMDYEWNKLKSNNYVLFSSHNITFKATHYHSFHNNNYKAIRSSAHGSSNANDRYTRLMTCIFDEMPLRDSDRQMIGRFFRTNPEWLKAAA